MKTFEKLKEHPTDDSIHLQRSVEERDIASYFLEDAEFKKDDPNHKRWLSGDTATVVVAGR